MEKSFIHTIFQLVLFYLSTTTVVAAKDNPGQRSDSNAIDCDIKLSRRAQVVTTIGSINRVEIINSKDDSIIKTLMNNTEIVLSEHRLSWVSQLNFKAVPSVNGTIRSMQFKIERNIGINTTNSTVTTRVDSTRPFSACGNTGNNFSVCNQRLNLGWNILTVTPYSRLNGSGIAGIPLILSFTIVRNTPACAIPKV
jgi:hypothetical protein